MFEGWGAAVVGAAVVGGVASSMSAKKAAGAQTDAANAGIAAENQRFEETKKILAPYVEVGNKSITAQGDIAGLNGPEAQAAATKAIEDSPQFAALKQQGEEGILQNASATGGLRGGNTQGALAQYRPQLLAGLIDQQYARLSGLTQIGQASAAGVGSAGIQNGRDQAILLGEIGAANAGKYLAYGKAVSDVSNSVVKAYGGGAF